MEAITVRKLISELQALPEDQQDLPVHLEGCDCTQEAGNVLLGENDIYGDPVVLIENTGN